MHLPINVKSPNISKWQMGFNSAFKGLKPGLSIQGVHAVGPCTTSRKVVGSIPDGFFEFFH
jgi:hypothetical protein